MKVVLLNGLTYNPIIKIDNSVEEIAIYDSITNPIKMDEDGINDNVFGLVQVR